MNSSKTLRFAILTSLVTLLSNCSSTHTASYHYTQKQIEMGDLTFAERLKVDEYINAFPQKHLASPGKGEELKLSVENFQNALSSKQKTNLVQIALKTRQVSGSESKENYGICIVLDISGSMTENHKLIDSLVALKKSVEEMNNGTEFALVTFSTDSRVDIEPTVMNNESKVKILNKISNLRTEGGTNIESGLLRGYQTMARFKTKISRLILITDGQSNVGITDPHLLAKETNSKYVQGARISTVGLGHDVEEPLLREIAEKGNGAYYFAENGKELINLLRRDLQSVMIPVAKNIELTLKPAKGFKIKTIYGYEQSLKPNGEATLQFGEMNVDDWRILIAEVESTSTSSFNNAIQAEATYESIAAKSKKTLSAKSSAKTDSLNKNVARNAVIFADAMALIEVSKLSKESRHLDASNILTTQIANVRVAKPWDDSGSMEKEETTLLSVKKIIDEQGGKSITQVETPRTNESAKSIIRDALSITEKVVPGPWSLLISIFSTVFVK